MTRHFIGFFLGLTLFLVIILLPPFNSFHAFAEHLVVEQNAALDPAQLAQSMQVVLALLVLMATWWITEAIPLPVTALLPGIVLPLFHLVGLSHGSVAEFTPRNILANYANPVIFLFLGGFLLAAAMQKWNLDRRVTLWLLSRGNIAQNTRSVVLAMMIVSALLSMWISNTATTAMLLPIGLGLIRLMEAQPGASRFATALMLGIAWAASIGGVGTIIGSPPNGIALGILNTTFADDPNYVRITFLDWMKFGVPYVVIFIPIAWLVLIKMLPPEKAHVPGGKQKIVDDRLSLGRFSGGEKGTISVFALMLILWLSNPFWDVILPQSLYHQLAWVDEYSIGLFGGVLLFAVPVNLREKKFLLEWRDTKFVEWGTLLLFGGGLALSDAMFKSGLAAWIATSFIGLVGTPSTLVMLFVIVLLVDLLTEMTSNTAVTSMIVPIVISIALSAGGNPITLAVGAAVAASMAFMLPVATPPNALVYAMGYVSLKDMMRVGLILDMLGWLLTTTVIVVFAAWLFGVVSL